MSESHRILVVGEQWFGATPRGVADGLRRRGDEVHTIDPRESIPAYSGAVLKASRRAMLPLLVRDYNRKLRELAQHFGPEIVLVIKGSYVKPATLRGWRRAGARVYNYYPDVSVSAFDRFIPRALPEYDHVFTTKSFQVETLRSKLGHERVTLLPHGYSPDVHRPLPLSEQDRQRFATDIGYIGNYSRSKERWLAAIRALVPDLRFTICGNGWKDRRRAAILRDCVIGGVVSGWAYSKLIQGTKINLAIHHGEVGKEGACDLMSTRSFEIPACGGFMLHERNGETESFYVDGEEVALFSDAQEAADKARYFLEHDSERRRIARSGHERCVPAYSYDARMAELIEFHQSTREPVIS